jgi:hypothetical protein
MSAELKIVHDTTTLLLKDGLALEKQIREQNEANRKLTVELRDLKELFTKEVAERDYKIEKMDYMYTKDKK